MTASSDEELAQVHPLDDEENATANPDTDEAGKTSVESLDSTEPSGPEPRDHRELLGPLKLPDKALEAVRDYLSDSTPEMAKAAVDIATRLADALPKSPPPSDYPIEELKPGSGLTERPQRTSWESAFRN